MKNNFQNNEKDSATVNKDALITRAVPQYLSLGREEERESGTLSRSSPAIWFSSSQLLTIEGGFCPSGFSNNVTIFISEQ